MVDGGQSQGPTEELTPHHAAWEGKRKGHLVNTVLVTV